MDFITSLPSIERMGQHCFEENRLEKDGEGLGNVEWVFHVFWERLETVFLCSIVLL